MSVTTIKANTAEAYGGSRENLDHHLARIAHYFNAQTVLWRHLVGAHKPSHLWGMIQISDSEIDTMLAAPFTPPGSIPDDLAAELEPHWRMAGVTAADIDARTANTPTRDVLRLQILVERFELSPLERDIVLICLLAELDSRYMRLVGYLLDDATRSRPTVALVESMLNPLLDEPAAVRAALMSTAPLVRHHMVRVGASNVNASGGGEVTADCNLALDPRIVAFLQGNDVFDMRLCGALRPAPDAPSVDALILDAGLQKRIAGMASWLGKMNENGAEAGLLYLNGSPGSGRKTVAAAVARSVDRSLLVVDMARLFAAGIETELAFSLVYREARLSGADIYWCNASASASEASHSAVPSLDDIAAYAMNEPVVSWFDGSSPWYPHGRVRNVPFMVFDFTPPGIEVRERLWRDTLPSQKAFQTPAPKRDQLAALLANGFQLNRGQISDAVKLAEGLARQRDPVHPLLSPEDLHEACRRQSGDRLVQLAQRIEPTGDMGFDDLVLRADNKLQLDELRNRIRLRNAVYSNLGFSGRVLSGKGLIALFTGSSGTGKTMAAQLLAQEQGVDLYKVDLSSIVSKYVGETEKNLSCVFAEAEDANAILFFDEADSLFGKRGDVKEARDRWANLEVNYLLQRVEEYSGVVILATNLRSNIDEAFLRRIHMIVEFPFPDGDVRAAIWKRLFPQGLARPADAVIEDMGHRFKLPGGSLRNITVDAAFRALCEAGEGSIEITRRHLVLSVCREYLKLGRPITPGDFGDEDYALVYGEILGRTEG